MRNRLENESSPQRNRLGQDTPTVETPVLSPLDRYLADVRGTLNGLSEAEKDVVFAEMRQHLLASAQAYEELGDTPEQALHNALAAFGASKVIGRSLSETYQSTGVARAALPRTAFRRAGQIFVVANLMLAILLTYATHRMLYHQMAFPQVGWDTLLAWLYFGIAAVVGGYVGPSLRVPRAWGGAFLMLAAMACSAGPFLLYLKYGGEYRGWESTLLLGVLLAFVLWLFIGCVFAGLSSVVACACRYQRRLRRAR